MKSFIAKGTAGENTLDFCTVLNAQHPRLKIAHVESIFCTHKSRGKGTKYARSEQGVRNINRIDRVVLRVRFLSDHIKISRNHQPSLTYPNILNFLAAETPCAPRLRIRSRCPVPVAVFGHIKQECAGGKVGRSVHKTLVNIVPYDMVRVVNTGKHSIIYGCPLR